MSRGGHRNGGRKRGGRTFNRNDDQRMIDALREILGMAPLYAPERHDETLARIAQDQIDFVAQRRARRGVTSEHAGESVIEDWKIER